MAVYCVVQEKLRRSIGTLNIDWAPYIDQIQSEWKIRRLFRLWSFRSRLTDFSVYRATLKLRAIIWLHHHLVSVAV